MNDDGTVDLSAAVATLSYLFVGGPPPRCADAADADDGGTLDISDAIGLLGYLFLGGDAPPPPFPEPGTDSTKDALADC